MSETKLIVGLGNPGPDYANTRHNAGFMVVDACVESLRGSYRDKFDGVFCKTSYRGQDVVWLKPLTYMNRSGQSVQKAARFFKVPPDQILVVHDELDLELGIRRLKVGGGHAGHNGLRSIGQCLATSDYHRLRFGVGKSPHGEPAERWVLQPFARAQDREVADGVEESCRMVLDWVTDGASAVMNRYHSK